MSLLDKKISRRSVLGLIFFSGQSLLSGCVTSSMLKSATNDFNVYREYIDSVLISADEKQLVVLGTQYHYVVPAPEELVHVLNSDIRQVMFADFSSTTVTANDELHCFMDLYASPTLETEKIQLLALGFKAAGEPDARKMKLSFGLCGKRYSAIDKIDLPSTYRLNKTYEVSVLEENKKLLKTVGAVLVSPVTLAADGVLLLGGIVLFPIAIPLYAVYAQANYRYGR